MEEGLRRSHTWKGGEKRDLVQKGKVPGEWWNSFLGSIKRKRVQHEKKKRTVKLPGRELAEHGKRRNMRLRL